MHPFAAEILFERGQSSAQVDRFHRPCFDNFAACSSAAARTSILDLDGLLEDGDGLVVLPFCDPDLATMTIGVFDAGIDCEGLVVVGECFIKFAFGVPGQTAVVVGISVARIDGDCLVEIA